MDFLLFLCKRCPFIQLNVAYPANGTQKLIEFDDEIKLRNFYDKRMAQECNVDFLGDEWKVRMCIIVVVASSWGIKEWTINLFLGKL